MTITWIRFYVYISCPLIEFMIADGWLLLRVTGVVGSVLTFVEHSVMETASKHNK